MLLVSKAYPYDTRPKKFYCVSRQVSSALGPLALALPIFSMTTLTASILGIATSQVDEFSALMPTCITSQNTESMLGTSLTFLPPLAAACVLTGPGTFEAVLEFGGTFGCLTLFGIIPCAMVWRQRRGIIPSAMPGIELLPGGTAALTVVAGASLALIASYSTALLT